MAIYFTGLAGKKLDGWHIENYFRSKQPAEIKSHLKIRANDAISSEHVCPGSGRF